MHVEIVVPSTDHDGRVYLGWTPVQATVRVIDGPGAGQNISVVLRNGGPQGQVVFDVVRSHAGTPTLPLDLPGDGSPVRFWVAGAFPRASVAFGDAVIEVMESGGTNTLGSLPLMVRVRKNGQTLMPAERDRFLTAFGTLNGHGTGRFKDFRDMHTGQTIAQAHGDLGFLPWHRAYLLDLERDLQAIDPEVVLPYWRFDQPAPNVFTLEFMGVPNRTGTVQFVPGHPFQQWMTDGTLGISRQMGFPVANAPPGLRTEQQTIAFGGGVYSGFWSIAVDPRGNLDPANSGIEIDPHGYAHISFRGSISAVSTAAKDPLFFMLHANVDRLWAKWQWFYKRTADTDSQTFPQGMARRPGHNVADSMWPWNGITTATDSTRPPTAPGGGMAPSALTTAPGPHPLVRSMLDYEAVNGGPSLGFDYDDVPFEITNPGTV
jgi:tyrosinase